MHAGNHAFEHQEPLAFANVEWGEVRISHHRTVFVSPSNCRLLGLWKFGKKQHKPFLFLGPIKSFLDPD